MGDEACFRVDIDMRANFESKASCLAVVIDWDRGITRAYSYIGREYLVG